MDIHNDFDGALRDVKNAQAIVARRQAETMAIVKSTVERGTRRRS